MKQSERQNEETADSATQAQNKKKDIMEHQTGPLEMEFRHLCNNYVEEFAKKHVDVIGQIRSSIDNVWIGNHYGEYAFLNDYIVDFNDIRYDIDYNVPKEKYFQWREKKDEADRNHRKFLNYESFCLCTTEHTDDN